VNECLRLEKRQKIPEIGVWHHVVKLVRGQGEVINGVRAYMIGIKEI
jgi:hypothetical protein